jgi:prophage antirepressor-like protein
MNNQQTKKFNDNNLSLIALNDDAWFTGADVGICLEYKNPVKAISDIYNRNQEELRQYSLTHKLPNSNGKTYKTRLYNEEGVMIITMLSRQPKAMEFRSWAVNILKTYRQGQFQSAKKISVYISEIPEGMIQIPKDEYIELLRIKITNLQCNK